MVYWGRGILPDCLSGDTSSILVYTANGSLDQMARSPDLHSGDWVRIPTYPQNAGIAQWLVFQSSKLRMRFRLSLPALSDLSKAASPCPFKAKRLVRLQ